MGMIKGVTAAEYNPRRLRADRLDSLHRSMRRFGDLGGIVVNRRTGTVIGGHQRLKAFDGSVEPVIEKRYDPPGKTGTTAEGYVILDGERWRFREVDVSEDRERAMNLAANAHGQGGWDKPKAAKLLQGLAATEEGVEDLGFTQKEVLDWVDLAERIDAGPVPAPPRGEVLSKVGEVYQLGVHRLMCGDSSDADAVAHLLDGARPKVTVADPPYVIDFRPQWRTEAGFYMTKGRAWVAGGSKGSFSGEIPSGGGPMALRQRTSYEDSPDNVDPGFPEQWKLSPGNVVYVWHSMLHSGRVLDAICEAGFDPVAYIVWDKGVSTIGRGHWSWAHETCLVAARADGEVEGLYGEPVTGCYYAVRRGKARHWRGGKQETIWRVTKPKSHDGEHWGHGAGKPLELYSRPVALHTLRGEAAYCPFGGSGTAIMAAESIGRTMYCMEKVPEYCDVIRARWAAHVGLPWPPE